MKDLYVDERVILKFILKNRIGGRGLSLTGLG